MSRQRKIEQFEQLRMAFTDQIQGHVYHYTSAAGLRGIVENHEIWLTNTAFVNDKKECKVLREKCDLFKENDFTNNYVKKQWDRYVKYAEDDNSFYISSFSCENNSLEQWRAYGSYCISFDINELKNKGYYLYECVYDLDDIKEWILQKEKVPEWDGNDLDEQAKRLAASELIFAASIKLKDKNYKNEREVRLFKVSNHKWGGSSNSPSLFEKDPPIHFHDHPFLKLPIPHINFYIPDNPLKLSDSSNRSDESKQEMRKRKLDFENACAKSLLPITEILVGPMAHQEDAVTACEILLAVNGYEKVEVTPSQIAYRGNL